MLRLGYYAREGTWEAAAARELVLEGGDPLEERRLAKAHVPTKFRLLASSPSNISSRFKRAFEIRSIAQWRNSLTTHAATLFPLAIDQVATEKSVAALQPIWLTKAETASRVRGRIEKVLDAAKVKGHRSGKNPVTWKGHLKLLLAKQTQIKEKHHAALRSRTWPGSWPSRRSDLHLPDFGVYDFDRGSLG